VQSAHPLKKRAHKSMPRLWKQCFSPWQSILLICCTCADHSGFCPLCADTQVNLRARLWPFTFRHKYAGESGSWQPLQQNTCRGYFLDEEVITLVPSRLTSFTRGWSSKDDHHQKWVVMNRGGQSHMWMIYV
jgi:hypothetical protein